MWAEHTANKTDAIMHCSSNQKVQYHVVHSPPPLLIHPSIVSVPTKRHRKVSVTQRIRKESAPGANSSQQSRKISQSKCHKYVPRTYANALPSHSFMKTGVDGLKVEGR